MEFRRKNKYYLDPCFYGELTKEGCYSFLFWVIAFFSGAICLFTTFAYISSYIFSNVKFKHIVMQQTSKNTLDTFLIMAIISGAVFIVALLIKIYFQKNDPAKKKRQEHRNWLITNGIEADGRIILILRKVEVNYNSNRRKPRKIAKYIFDAEYYDKEKHKYRTVSSEYYYNDIREVFADDKVKIYFNPDDKYDYIIDGMKLRQSDSEPAFEFPFKSWTDEIY